MSPAHVIAPASGKRLAGIEGLRGVACILVVMLHVWQYTPNGVQLGTAVALLPYFQLPRGGLTLFFLLSGFLLYRPFIAAAAHGRPLPSVRGYLRNRALRIVPAYWTILLIVALVVGVAVTSTQFGLDGNLDHVGYLTDPVKLFANLFLLQTFWPHGLATGLGTAWTLSVEVVFYLVLPALVMLAVRLMRSERFSALLSMAIPAGLLIVLGTAGKVVAAVTTTGAGKAEAWGPTWHAVFERSFLAHADLLGYGMLVAVLLVHVDTGHPLPRVLRRPGLLAIPAGLIAAILMGEGRAGPQTYDILCAWALGLLLLHIVLPRPERTLVARTLELRPLAYIGMTSYSIYLWHVPVVLWMREHDMFSRGVAATFTNVVLAFGVAIVLASVTYHLVEAPALRRKTRSARDRAVVGPDAGMVEAAP